MPATVDRHLERVLSVCRYAGHRSNRSYGGSASRVGPRMKRYISDSFRPLAAAPRDMYEIEVKVRADHELVRRELQTRGAEPLGAVRQVDTYHDHPGRSFAETDEALRLRREERLDGDRDADGESDGAARLTYKGPLVESASKTREEIETGVEDAAAVDSILAAVDFEPAAEVHKERERFALSGYTVTLDSVDGAGEFVEIERDGTEAEIEDLRAGARDLLRDLGLDPAEHVRTSYLELVLEEGNNGGVDN